MGNRFAEACPALRSHHFISVASLRAYPTPLALQTSGPDGITTGLKFATAGEKTEDGEDAPEKVLDVGMIIG